MEEPAATRIRGRCQIHSGTEGEKGRTLVRTLRRVSFGRRGKAWALTKKTKNSDTDDKNAESLRDRSGERRGRG